MRTLTLTGMTVVVAATAAACSGDGGRSDSVAEFEPVAIDVGYSWIGLGPPRGYHFAGPCDDDVCNVTVTCYNNADTYPAGETGPSALPPATIDVALVRDFTATFDDLDPIAEATEVIEHTDDYPDLTVTLTDADGDTAEISTTSNTRDRTPWNVEFAGSLSVSHASESATAYRAIADAAAADTCWNS